MDPGRRKPACDFIDTWEEIFQYVWLQLRQADDGFSKRTIGSEVGWKWFSDKAAWMRDQGMGGFSGG